MNDEGFRTLKEVVDDVGRPPHRVIHLCETGVVSPAVGADGRGSVRRFSREDLFRVRLGLNLQDAGIQVPLIRPFMRNLDGLLDIPQIGIFCLGDLPFDLVSAIKRLGSEKEPVLASITPPNLLALVAPKVPTPGLRNLRLSVHSDIKQLVFTDVSVIVNLTENAAGL